MPLPSPVPMQAADGDTRLVSGFSRIVMAVPSIPNAIWSLDFMHDTLYVGRRFRTLNVLDEGVREVLNCGLCF